jgi:hypothetical protein
MQFELLAQLKQLALMASPHGHRHGDDRDSAKHGDKGAGHNAARRTQ